MFGKAAAARFPEFGEAGGGAARCNPGVPFGRC